MSADDGTDLVHLRVSRQVRGRVNRLAGELRRVKGRRVTVSETIEYMLDQVDSSARLMQDIARSQPEGGFTSGHPRLPRGPRP